MDEIKVLVQGYIRTISAGRLVASPSTILVRSLQNNLLVDPGANPQLLLESLSREGLKPADIHMVFLTHYHPDHILNIRLFPQHDICDGTTLYRGDEEISYSGTIPKTNVEVVLTPGHTREHVSLLVNTEEGVYAVAGDVFWWEDGQEPRFDEDSLLALPDRFAEDMVVLIESRRKLLREADFIIPGHGRVVRNMRLRC
jgi:glyoxylase-like metal-dependent hydrolase (beta-lactamase superfamily II)